MPMVVVARVTAVLTVRACRAWQAWCLPRRAAGAGGYATAGCAARTLPDSPVPPAGAGGDGPGRVVA